VRARIGPSTASGSCQQRAAGNRAVEPNRGPLPGKPAQHPTPTSLRELYSPLGLSGELRMGGFDRERDQRRQKITSNKRSPAVEDIKSVLRMRLGDCATDRRDETSRSGRLPHTAIKAWRWHRWTLVIGTLDIGSNDWTTSQDGRHFSCAAYDSVFFDRIHDEWASCRIACQPSGRSASSPMLGSRRNIAPRTRSCRLSCASLFRTCQSPSRSMAYEQDGMPFFKHRPRRE
jgi:hypothetical protein